MNNKETLDTIKQMIADGVLGQETAEKYFPELAESEDERIRKWCISHFKECINVIKDNDEYKEYLSNKVIAWLEKQGENTYNKELSELLHKVICRFINAPDISYSDREKVSMKVLPYVERLEKQGEQKHVFPKFRVGDTVKAKTMDNFMFTIKDITDKQYVDTNGGKYDIEGQDYLELVEQKPAWSEEDNNCLSTIIAEFSKCAGKSVSKDEWMRCNDFLNSLKNRVQPQPQQEWSEEDVYALNTLSAMVANNCLLAKEEIFKLLDWLNSIKSRLYLQEWSEADKRKINRIYSILRQAADTHAFSTSYRLIGDKECIELQDFLKSLRPQNRWKPSDEQMEALDDFIYAKYPNVEKHGAAVKSLYQDLKKLREE